MVWISDQQRTVHIVTEAAAVFLTVPFLLWAANRTPDKTAAAGMRALAAGALVVDGWLLYRFLSHTTANVYVLKRAA